MATNFTRDPELEQRALESGLTIEEVKRSRLSDLASFFKPQQQQQLTEPVEYTHVEAVHVHAEAFDCDSEAEAPLVDPTDNQKEPVDDVASVCPADFVAIKKELENLRNRIANLESRLTAVPEKTVDRPESAAVLADKTDVEQTDKPNLTAEHADKQLDRITGSFQELQRNIDQKVDVLLDNSSVLDDTDTATIAESIQADMRSQQKYQDRLAALCEALSLTIARQQKIYETLASCSSKTNLESFTARIEKLSDVHRRALETVLEVSQK